MAISMYSASVPVFVRVLTSMGKWLAKAEAHAQAKKFDVNVLLTARLAPDMLPFTRQIQIACDGAKFGAARLAGVVAPRFEDNEASVDELKARISKTLDYLQTFTPEMIDGSEGRDITVPQRSGDLQMKGEPYLHYFALPNFYFHATTAYGLLRHNGVELGKGDFLGYR
jgi:uncharacterized protein